MNDLHQQRLDNLRARKIAARMKQRADLAKLKATWRDVDRQWRLYCATQLIRAAFWFLGGKNLSPQMAAMFRAVWDSLARTVDDKK